MSHAKLFVQGDFLLKRTARYVYFDYAFLWLVVSTTKLGRKVLINVIIFFSILKCVSYALNAFRAEVSLSSSEKSIHFFKVSLVPFCVSVPIIPAFAPAISRQIFILSEINTGLPQASASTTAIPKFS